MLVVYVLLSIRIAGLSPGHAGLLAFGALQWALVADWPARIDALEQRFASMSRVLAAVWPGSAVVSAGIANQSGRLAAGWLPVAVSSPANAARCPAGVTRGLAGVSSRSKRTGFTDHRSPITDHRSPITDHRSPITDHRSPITDHQSPITNHAPAPAPRARR